VRSLRLSRPRAQAVEAGGNAICVTREKPSYPAVPALEASRVARSGSWPSRQPGDNVVEPGDDLKLRVRMRVHMTSLSDLARLSRMGIAKR
jgi:hypothetical protein